MSETDPLRGYTEGTSSGFQQYNRIRKDAITTRNCRLTICGLVLVGIALTVAVIVVFSIDNTPAVEVIPDERANLTLLDPMEPVTSNPLPIKSNTTDEQGIWVTSAMLRVDGDVLNECTQMGQAQADKRSEMEAVLFDVFAANRRNTPSFYHQMATALDPSATDLCHSAVIAETSLKCLRDHGINLKNIEKSDSQILQKDWPQCHKNNYFECPSKEKYRSLEGTCNNQFKPYWGSALQPYRRILPAEYNDSFSTPRTDSVVGGPLPPSRQISICLQNATNQLDEPKINMLFVMFGHFLDTDISSIAATKGINRTGIPCCDMDSVVTHPECFPIEMKDNDPFYSDKGMKCMDFVRSAPAPQCKLEGREQMNQATSYIDLSNVYGTSELQSRTVLRDLNGGYLRTPTEKDGRYMLPRSLDPDDGCNKPDMIAINRYCFNAGDSRVNEYIGLTAMQTIWMREHNRVTDYFIKLNPTWSDDRLYEESRRIVIAEMQHITFNEFVPILIGPKLVDVWKLKPQKRGYYFNDYDERVSSGIGNAFATATFRFLHSMVKDLTAFEPISTGGKTANFIELHKMLFNPFSLWDFGIIDDLIRGAAKQNPRPLHTSFADEVANHLFQQDGQDFGFDLFAINIQRGRDHGIPPYVRFREICNLSPVKNFTDLEGIFRPHSLEILQRFYKDARDLDLYTGILAENPLEEGLLGPVGSCIVSDQFARLKRGDRFWFETGDYQLKFDVDQLASIHNVTFARILCDNGDGLDGIQERAMEPISDSNPRRLCTETDFIPRINLTLWKDYSQDNQ